MTRKLRAPNAGLFQCLWITLGCVLFCSAVSGAEFRVESEVFVDGKREPVVETLTLFSDGVVYDFMLTGFREITVFDPLRGRLILLNPARKQKTTISTDEILEFTTGLRAHIHEHGRQDQFDPAFQQDFDDEQSLVTLTSDSLVYRAHGQRPKFALAVRNYQQFADWYARLNAMRSANVAPFARIQLNKALAGHQLVPTEVERDIIATGRRARRHTVTSRHLFNWRLSRTDRERISRVSEYTVNFEPVTFTQYREEMEQTAARQ